jgi:hypothetical protein
VGTLHGEILLLDRVRGRVATVSGEGATSQGW